MSWLKDYFSFTRRERTAFICLLLLLAFFLYLPEFFRPAGTSVAATTPVSVALAASTDSAVADKNAGERGDTNAVAAAPQLFRFDPNKLDETGWLQLGLSPREAKTIIHYRNKGGRFRRPEDLRKMYSLSKQKADRIIPYADFEEGRKENEKAASSPIKAKPILEVNVNTATVDEWKALPGVGEVLSNRIVQYRERIGGFRSIDQVAKTFGLKDSTFQVIRPYLVLHEKGSKGIDLNSAFENELMECEGMTRDLAKAILIFRKNHGRFEHIDDLKKIIIVNEEVFRKIAPCMRVD